MFFIIKKMNKRGVSPIIATVLLIAFAVALGAVVMNWGKSFVESTAQDTETKANLDLACGQSLSFGIKKIGQTPKICFNSTSIQVMLENTGTFDITGMQIMFFDNTSDSSNVENNTLRISAGSVTKMMAFSHNLTGDIVQVEFIPKITPKGAVTAQLCSKTSIEVTDLTTCS